MPPRINSIKVSAVNPQLYPGSHGQNAGPSAVTLPSTRRVAWGMASAPQEHVGWTRETTPSSSTPPEAGASVHPFGALLTDNGGTFSSTTNSRLQSRLLSTVSTISPTTTPSAPVPVQKTLTFELKNGKPFLSIRQHLLELERTNRATGEHGAQSVKIRYPETKRSSNGKLTTKNVTLKGPNKEAVLSAVAKKEAEFKELYPQPMASAAAKRLLKEDPDLLILRQHGKTIYITYWLEGQHVNIKVATPNKVIRDYNFKADVVIRPRKVLSDVKEKVTGVDLEDLSDEVVTCLNNSPQVVNRTFDAHIGNKPSELTTYAPENYASSSTTSSSPANFDELHSDEANSRNKEVDTMHLGRSLSPLRPLLTTTSDPSKQASHVRTWKPRTHSTLTASTPQMTMGTNLQKDDYKVTLTKDLSLDAQTLLKSTSSKFFILADNTRGLSYVVQHNEGQINCSKIVTKKGLDWYQLPGQNEKRVPNETTRVQTKGCVYTAVEITSQGTEGTGHDMKTGPVPSVPVVAPLQVAAFFTEFPEILFDAAVFPELDFVAAREILGIGEGVIYRIKDNNIYVSYKVTTWDRELTSTTLKLRDMVHHKKIEPEMFKDSPPKTAIELKDAIRERFHNVECAAALDKSIRATLSGANEFPTITNSDDVGYTLALTLLGNPAFDLTASDRVSTHFTPESPSLQLGRQDVKTIVTALQRLGKDKVFIPFIDSATTSEWRACYWGKGKKGMPKQPVLFKVPSSPNAPITGTLINHKLNRTGVDCLTYPPALKVAPKTDRLPLKFVDPLQSSRSCVYAGIAAESSSDEDTSSDDGNQETTLV